ncbi:MAG: hypothetical protein FJ279_30865 [Planctomycetes bacterium]|nr:hypothetical protein [Planctomycetota bacterium]
MSPEDLLTAVRALPRADKLRLVHLLVVELAREEKVKLAEEEGPYPVWTPYDAYDAAGALWQALRQDEGER